MRLLMEFCSQSWLVDRFECLDWSLYLEIYEFERITCGDITVTLNMC